MGVERPYDSGLRILSGGAVHRAGQQQTNNWHWVGSLPAFSDTAFIHLLGFRSGAAIISMI